MPAQKSLENKDSGAGEAVKRENVAATGAALGKCCPAA
jgi:hypothetical protein